MGSEASIKGVCTALEYFYQNCSWERDQPMKYLKMISISTILLIQYCRDGLVQVVDQTILIKEVEEMPLPAATVAAREDNNENEIEADEETQGIVNICQLEANVYKCMVLVLGIGLACIAWSNQKKECFPWFQDLKTWQNPS